MIQKLLFLLAVFALTACSTVTAPAGQKVPAQTVVNGSNNKVNTVQTFAHQIAIENGLSEQTILDVLSQAQMQPNIVAAMNRPYEALPWSRYQQLYVRPSLIAGGVKFWKQYQNILLASTKQFGVPPQIILAILGVETAYGQNIGNYRALDALYTLSFGYPRRAAFFQNELEAYLVLSQEAGFDPVKLKSSYAGALGMPQFMPTTYRRYAVSNTKNYPDLFGNVGDIAGSIGNYLDKMGWQKDAPIAISARFNKGVKVTDALTSQTLTLEQFKQQGVHAEEKMPGELKANLLVLQGSNGPEYWLVFHNFYVIKKYNASNLYAMAVYQLSEKIACQIPNGPNLGLDCTGRVN